MVSNSQYRPSMKLQKGISNSRLLSMSNRCRPMAPSKTKSLMRTLPPCPRHSKVVSKGESAMTRLLNLAASLINQIITRFEWTLASETVKRLASSSCASACSHPWWKKKILGCLPITSKSSSISLRILSLCYHWKSKFRNLRRNMRRLRAR